MRNLLYLLAAFVVIALATWAYRENHLTQQALNTRTALEREVAQLQAAIDVQRVEWAYLNRPDRLRRLVELNLDTLQLVPITGGQFAAIGDIAYPDPAPRRPAPALSVPEPGTLLSAPAASSQEAAR